MPSTEFDKSITPAQFEARTYQVAELFAYEFGGATIEPVKGFYKADNGQVITESINKVIAYTDKISPAELISDFVVSMRETWIQESIAIETNTGLMFI